MNASTTQLDKPGAPLRATPGQVALAERIRDGVDRPRAGGSSVPASHYTDPMRFQLEKSALFDRLPQVLVPSALLP